MCFLVCRGRHSLSPIKSEFLPAVCFNWFTSPSIMSMFSTPYIQAKIGFTEMSLGWHILDIADRWWHGCMCWFFFKHASGFETHRWQGQTGWLSISSILVHQNGLLKLFSSWNNHCSTQHNHHFTFIQAWTDLACVVVPFSWRALIMNTCVYK